MASENIIFSDVEYSPCWGRTYDEKDERCSICGKRLSCKADMQMKSAGKGLAKWDPFVPRDVPGIPSIAEAKVKVSFTLTDGSKYEGEFPLRPDSVIFSQQRMIGRYPSTNRMPVLTAEELRHLPILFSVEGLMLPGSEITVTNTVTTEG